MGEYIANIWKSYREVVSFSVMGALLVYIGFGQSWALALGIFNLCVISSIMALGVNIQWGYAGLFNVGIMGFTALGGLAVVIVSQQPVVEAIDAGGLGMLVSIALIILTVAVSLYLHKNKYNKWWVIISVVVGFIAIRYFYSDATRAIEAVNTAKTGYLGGLGLPVVFSWIVGGMLAAGAAWIIGKISLGLRSDYLAIATLGISEIVLYIIKNEDWLARGVKNVTGLQRPVPYELKLQQAEWFQDLVRWIHQSK
ncbi:MAG TPA: branched-chain amino acid ABC transporter permease, partial [Gammaproteobacteria bacterium]|nr:branched-chain amino acid ABC transporter permease [Gammaproteobacteria bacterium]